MRERKFITMYSKILVFIGLLQQVFIVSIWIDLSSCLKIVVVREFNACFKCMYFFMPENHSCELLCYFNRKPLATNNACLLMVFGNFQILNFIYSS